MAEQKAKREEEASRLFYLQSLYNQQYEAVMNELATFGMAQGALERNVQLLDRKDRLKNSNILVNAEGGTYIGASIKEVNGVLTYVGSGYLVEKDVQQAKEFLGKSIEGTKEQIKRLAEQKQKIENELIRVQYAIEALQQGQ